MRTEEKKGEEKRTNEIGVFGGRGLPKLHEPTLGPAAYAKSDARHNVLAMAGLQPFTHGWEEEVDLAESPEQHGATSAAERQREYRARRDADPEKREKYLRHERQRWRRDVEAGKKKGIKELSERGQRTRRKMWRQAKRRQKNREQLALGPTPPVPETENHVPMSHQATRQSVQGKKKTRKSKEKMKKKIAELEQLLQQERQQKEKYKKRLQRVKNDLPRSPVKKTLHYHEALKLQIQETYKQAKTEKQRQLISGVVVSGIMRKYRMLKKSECALGFSKKRRSLANCEILKFKRKKITAFDDMKKKVKEFFTRDDVSRITTGKNQTSTKNKTKMQKRFMVDTMKNLHQKFMSENPGRLSYSMFCRLRPFWVVKPSLADRETCMCKLHENLSFVAQKLKQLQLIETSELEELANQICCSPSNKHCMYGECEQCKKEIIPISDAYKPEEDVVCPQWIMKEKNKKNEDEKTVKITVKENLHTSQENLVEMFHSLLHRFRRYLFNIKQQYAHCRELKRHMPMDECLIHIDFSENFTCRYGAEVHMM
ncbi:uncharacterized protein LOC132900231 [Neoarius graeffei]|uniref:uncharacterized protein LOC132900231 n=1 Tax=Neoarius graeffei TaxID=443677 RepID=UPI00298CFB86|nr:uncharacterized protein LOC132900231 [Neoarius graeffei]